MRAMRVPLEYGDNFPVPTGSWDPTVPWRFPKHRVELQPPSILSWILPWLMLGLGVALGVLLMGWNFGPVSGQWQSAAPVVSGQKYPSLMPGKVAPAVTPAAPRGKLMKKKSRVA